MSLGALRSRVNLVGIWFTATSVGSEVPQVRLLSKLDYFNPKERSIFFRPKDLIDVPLPQNFPRVVDKDPRIDQGVDHGLH